MVETLTNRQGRVCAGEKFPIALPARFLRTAGLEMDLFRDAIVERLVRTLKVVKIQVALNAQPGFSRAAIIAQVDFLVLDGSPQTLGKNVVQRPTPPIHADLHLGIQQLLKILWAGEVTALALFQISGQPVPKA